MTEKIEDGITYQVVRLPNGTETWHLNGMRHREKGPAVIYPDGLKIWYRCNLIHSEISAALEHPNGEKLWVLNGQELGASSQEEFEKWMKLKAFW